jgi:hypothetical protein
MGLLRCARNDILGWDYYFYERNLLLVNPGIRATNTYIYAYIAHICHSGESRNPRKTVNDPPEDTIDELALMPLAGEE